MLARVGGMVCHATTLGLSPLHAAGFEPGAAWDAACPEVATLAAAYASHSWRLTAPLRWLRGRLPLPAGR